MRAATLSRQRPSHGRSYIISRSGSATALSWIVHGVRRMLCGRNIDRAPPEKQDAQAIDIQRSILFLFLESLLPSDGVGVLTMRFSAYEGCQGRSGRGFVLVVFWTLNPRSVTGRGGVGRESREYPGPRCPGRLDPATAI